VNAFGDIKDAFISFLEFLHDEANLTYGWAIVAITIMVRLLILPLFIKQYRSMRRMQAYAPQIKELQARYKGNRQKLNEEMMRFYKENQINPFSSCLPLVAQAPVFIVLYYALREFSRTAETREGALDFMWVIPDISRHLLDIGWGAAVLLAIYATSQLLASELSMTPATAGNQKWLMRFLPLMIVFFVTTFPVPSGVVIYWVTTNLWTCGQQLVIKRKIGPNPYLEEAAEVAAARPGKAGSRTPPKGATALAPEEGAPAPPEKRKQRPAARGGVGETPSTNGRPGRASQRRRPRTAPPAETPADRVPPNGEPSGGVDVEGEPPEVSGAEPSGGPGAGRGPKGSKPRPRGGGGPGGGRRQPRKKR
jgi:YidC/Oxa1 family membrane protein insertase